MKSKLKKSLSLLLALVMCLSVMSVGAMADGETDTWDGETKTEVTPTDDTYLVSTGAELAWIANQVNNGTNNFAGKTVRLTADINLGNHAWTPIGISSSNSFKGVFDGQNHTISNLTISADNNAALFGYIKGTAHESFTWETVFKDHSPGYNSATYVVTPPDETIFGCEVKDLTVSGASLTASSKYAAVVATCFDATVKGVTVTNSTITADKCAGGVVAFVPDGAAAFIDHCTTGNDVSVNATTYHAAGILARVDTILSRVIISNCTNNATISSAGVNGGGIAGMAKYTLFYNCINNGNVKGKTKSAGITTDSRGSVIIKCTNTGAIESTGDANTKGDCTAGIAASLVDVPAVVVNCTNNGPVTAKCSGDAVVCGIVYCDQEKTSIVLNCVNTGDLVNNGDGKVYPISNVEGVMKSFAPADLAALNGALDENNKIVEVTNLTLPYDNCTITPVAQKILTFVNSPKYLTIDLSGVTTSSLQVNVSNATISVVGNSEKSDFELDIIGSNNNITYAKDNTLRLKQLTVQDDSGSSTVTVSADLTKLKLAGTGAVTATVSEGATVDRVFFMTAGGTYTLNNYGTISHTQSDSNQNGNEHTVDAEVSCTVTVNNYGTIEAKPNINNFASYAVLLYCTTATVNEFLNSKITAEDGYRIRYGVSTEKKSFVEEAYDGIVAQANFVDTTFINVQDSLYLNVVLYVGGTEMTNGSVKFSFLGIDETVALSDFDKPTSATLDQQSAIALATNGYYCYKSGNYYVVRLKVLAYQISAEAAVQLLDGDGKAVKLYQNTGASCFLNETAPLANKLLTINANNQYTGSVKTFLTNYSGSEAAVVTALLEYGTQAEKVWKYDGTKKA